MAPQAISQLPGRLSLAARLLIGSGAAMAVSGLMLLYSVLLGEIDFNRKQLIQRLDDEMSFLLPTVQEQAVVGDYASIQQMLEVRAKRPEIARITWTDTKGNPIESKSPAIAAVAPEWFRKFVDMPELEKVHPVEIGGVDYGKVSLALTSVAATNNIWQGFLDKVQMLFLGVGLFFGVTLAIITNGLAPLYALASAARRFGQGDYSVRVPPTGAPELLESFHAFNSMADSIESLLTSLRESNASNRRLAAIVEQSNEAIITRNLNGIITTWNRGATRLYGYTPAEALGKPETFLLPAGGEGDRPEGGNEIALDSVVTCETQRVNKDGATVDVELSVAPLMDENGKAIGSIGVARDITERKQTQEALHKAKQAAEAASRSKSQFLANMSHEIRTPMNGVLGMTELLLATELTDTQRRFVQTVHRSGEALLNIINDILDFSKIEAGKLELESIDFALHEVVEDVAELLAERAHSKGLELVCRIHPDAPARVCGDPVRLRQILTNLVGNAVKFTDSGEVMVAVSLAEADAEPAVPGEFVLQFAVSDTGPGISPDAQSRIFDSFSQADGSTTRKYGGTGLGLAITKQLVEMMGGRIGIESVQGKGSTFWFTARLKPATTPDTRPLQPIASLGGLWALVVEDNPSNRSILEHQLAHAAMQVGSAASGGRALEELRRAVAAGRPYDLALVDMKMPAMNGIELAQAVKADPSLAGLRMVMLTSITSPGEASKAREAGFAAYLSKPVRQSELYRCIASAMGTATGERRIVSADPVDASGPLRGRRVLMAEDNPVNQAVALAMLESLGVAVDVADNGREALEQLAAERYDVVLMDCQMPELDGFAATAAIREREAQTAAPRLPVIALTANAMEGDRERCLAAGMDDYLAKPFKRTDILGMLQRWLPEADAGSPAPARLPTPTVALDQAALDQIRSLKGGEELVARLVDLYLDNAPKLLEQMRSALALGDWAGVGDAAHSLKSSSANLGAGSLAKLCLAIETEARQGALADGAARIAAAGAEFDAVRAALREQVALAAN